VGLLAATAIAALGQRLHPGALAAATAGLGLLAVLAGGWAFAQASVWASPVPVLALALAAYAASALVGYVGARRRAREIRLMFAQYVPPEVVAELVAHPERLQLGGETRELTVMFTDLAGFTDLAEGLGPEDTVAMLTEYFDTMTAIVHRHRGTVDKFIGDAVMAFWGAPLHTPDHARLALAAAQEMQAAVATLSQRLQARGLPPLRMRIGLHSGPAVVGNIGSASRFSYTAVGDTVNLAARLEGANKAFGSGLLVSQATLDAAGPQATQGMRALADVVVKGKTQAVRVYTPSTDATLRQRAAALLEASTGGDAPTLAARLSELLTHAPGDAAAQLMRQRWGQDLAWGAPLPLDKL
jgi:adenylate cyclase